MNITNYTSLQPVLDCTAYLGLAETIGFRMGIMVMINVIAVLSITIVYKLKTWNKISEGKFWMVLPWGILPALMSSLWLLEVYLRGL